MARKRLPNGEHLLRSIYDWIPIAAIREESGGKCFFSFMSKAHEHATRPAKMHAKVIQRDTVASDVVASRKPTNI